MILQSVIDIDNPSNKVTIDDRFSIYPTPNKSNTIKEIGYRKEISNFKVSCRINNEIVSGEMEVVGGPVDAAFKTLKKILSKKYPEIEELNILDFHVSIARQKSEESSVRTRINFTNQEEFSTIGVDPNMLGSAIEALEKGFRYYLVNLMKESERRGNGSC